LTAWKPDGKSYGFSLLRGEAKVFPDLMHRGQGDPSFREFFSSWPINDSSAARAAGPPTHKKLALLDF
jgi:hypothetical protein